MARTSFQARIDEEINGLIVVYTEYIGIKNGFGINPGDVNRAIIKKGIENLIASEGGLKHIQDVTSKNHFDDVENGLFAPFVSVDEFADKSPKDQEQIIEEQLAAGKKYIKKYGKGEK